MSLPERPAKDTRIGDVERNLALDRLSELTGSGHLDLTEFDERSRLVAAAHTRGELEQVFTDLPAASDTEATQELTQPQQKMLDNRKTAALGLSTVVLVIAAAVFSLPWLILVAPALVLITWLSGKGPSEMYRDED